MPLDSNSPKDHTIPGCPRIQWGAFDQNSTASLGVFQSGSVPKPRRCSGHTPKTAGRTDSLPSRLVAGAGVSFLEQKIIPESCLPIHTKILAQSRESGQKLAFQKGKGISGRGMKRSFACPKFSCPHRRVFMLRGGNVLLDHDSAAVHRQCCKPRNVSRGDCCLFVVF